MTDALDVADQLAYAVLKWQSHVVLERLAGEYRIARAAVPDRGEMVEREKARERMGALLEQWSYPRSTWERFGITAEAAALALLDAALGPATDQTREGK